jgi:hypothetical protein
MTTTAGHFSNRGYGSVRSTRRVALASGRTRSVSLGAVGLVALVVSAWGGIIPYVGPAFGFSGDGLGSWHWNLSHAVLALIPGAIGFLFALSLMGRTAAGATLRRVGLTFGGLIAIASGAWFVIGPMAWPVLVNGGHYFVTSSPLGELEYQVGYALGPGLILAACGAFAMGWSARHDRPLGTLGTDAMMPAEAGVPMHAAQPVPVVTQSAPVVSESDPAFQGRSRMRTRRSWRMRNARPVVSSQSDGVAGGPTYE